MKFQTSRSKNFLTKRKVKRPVITLLGDNRVGKSCIAIQFCCSRFYTPYDPTVEEIFKQFLVVDDQDYVLDFLDTAGTREYPALLDAQIARGDGFLLIYSTVSRSSFLRIKTLHDQIRRVRHNLVPSGLGTESIDNWMTGPSMIVGTKTDLEADREVLTDEGRDLAQRLGCQFAEITVKSHSEVRAVVVDIVRSMAEFQGSINQEISNPPRDMEKKDGLCDNDDLEQLDHGAKIVSCFRGLLGVKKL